MGRAWGHALSAVSISPPLTPRTHTRPQKSCIRFIDDMPQCRSGAHVNPYRRPRRYASCSAATTRGLPVRILQKDPEPPAVDPRSESVDVEPILVLAVSASIGLSSASIGLSMRAGSCSGAGTGWSAGVGGGGGGWWRMSGDPTGAAGGARRSTLAASRSTAETAVPLQSSEQYALSKAM